MRWFDKAVRAMIRPKRHGLGPGAAIAATIGVGTGLLYALDRDGGPGRLALVRSRKEGTAPVARVLMAALGAGAVGWAIKHRHQLRLMFSVLGAAGAVLLLRSRKGRPVQHLLGVGAGRRAVHFQKTIAVRAPIEEVFSRCLDFASFPQFMPHLREVDLQGDGRTRWTAVGPAGISLRWEAEITEIVPNKAITWRSVPGSPIASSGTVRFEEAPDGRTRMEIKLSYSPPAGVIGRAVARLLRADPMRAMDEDILRFRSFVEQSTSDQRDEPPTQRTGSPPANASPAAG